MDSAPLGNVLNEDNETDEEFIKFRKESSSKKGIVHSIKLERKKTHQGEIRFWESIKLWGKKKAIKLEKTSTKKEIHQVVREYWFIKRHERHEIQWKIIQVEKDEQKWRFIKRRNLIKLRKMRKRKSKMHFIKKKCVFSQVKKNESALERIRGYQGEMQIHPRKMEVYQIERNKKCSWVKANKIPKNSKKSSLGWKPERAV